MPVAADARGDAMTLSSCAGLLLLEDGPRHVQMAASAVKLSAAESDVSERALDDDRTLVRPGPRVQCRVDVTLIPLAYARNDSSTLARRRC